MTLPLWPVEEQRTQPRRVTLARLAGEIARSMAAVGPVAVEGEVHRPQVSKAGWTYFTLKDRASQLPVAVPAKYARRCRAVNGERALVLGHLSWVNDRGQLVLEAQEVTPVGEGAVAAMIAESRSRLAADGLLDRPRRPLPMLPAIIGVLCGAEAAVRRDIESVIADRFAGYPVVFEETTVSGPGAAGAVVEALGRLSRRAGVEVVVLARGGGDATALLPWSDEELCRAVAACPVPVVSAIGHESDHPLCDEVADLRCGTPSIAAHHVVPDRAAIDAALAEAMSGAARCLGNLGKQSRQRLDRAQVSGALAAGQHRARQRLAHARARLVWAHPAPAASECRRRLVGVPWALPVAARLATGRQRLGDVVGQARALSPRHVVERGFAVVRRADGSVVRSPAEVVPGERLHLDVARGVIDAVVVGGDEG